MTFVIHDDYNYLVQCQLHRCLICFVLNIQSSLASCGKIKNVQIWQRQPMYTNCHENLKNITKQESVWNSVEPHWRTQ